MTVSTQNQISSFTADGNNYLFDFDFFIEEYSDLEVIVRDSNGVETIQVLNTDYTGVLKTATGGRISLQASTPASGSKVYIRRKLDLVQETDYQEGATFPAASHEKALDRLTHISQQLQEQIDRCIKASITTPITNPEFNDADNDRRNKIFAFDADGNIDVTQELGIYRGDWATGTAYKVRDIVRDNGNLNVYIVNTSHTSSGSLPISSNTDSSKFDILIDATGVVSAASSAASTAAATSAAEALASEQAAAASEANALTYSQTATTQATAAQGHSSDAQGYASTAAGHATTASGHATTATNQAGIATTKASEANQSAVDAAQQFDDFEVRYLGYNTVDPTTDNNGGALIDGALYFDTTNSVLKVYDLTNDTWLATTPSAANLAKIDTVQADLVGSNTIGTVAGDIGNVQVLAPISSDISAVAGNNTNVTTVAGQITPTNNIQTLGGISQDITEVAGISSAVSDVASNEAAITGVNGNITEVVGVYTSLGTIINVDNNSSNITAVSNNETAITNVANNLGSLSTVSDAFTEYATSYLGGKTANPTVDNDGNALQDGALYYNTASDVFRVYSQGSWKSVALSEASSQVTDLVTIGNPRDGTSINSATFSVAPPAIYDIFLNGSRLRKGADYTQSTDGSGNLVITLAVTGDGFGAGDEVALAGFTSFGLADAVPASQGGTFSGDVDVAANLDVTGNFTVAGTVSGDGIDNMFGNSLRVFDSGIKLGGNTGAHNSLFYKSYDPDQSNIITLVDTGIWGQLSPSNFQAFTQMTRMGQNVSWGGRIRFNYSTAYNLANNHSIGVRIPNTFAGDIQPYGGADANNPVWVGRGRIDSSQYGTTSSLVDIYAYDVSGANIFVFHITDFVGSPTTQDYIYFNVNYVSFYNFQNN